MSSPFCFTPPSTPLLLISSLVKSQNTDFSRIAMDLESIINHLKDCTTDFQEMKENSKPIVIRMNLVVTALEYLCINRKAL